MLSFKEKQKIIEKFRHDDSDTGSSEIQIALLSTEIKELSNHLKKHRKDNHSRRGLLKMVAKRRKLLQYLAREDNKRYETIIKKLELKK
ncbi:30S ribosomal protein S15 [Patescibacteria group bacterium]